uniref:IMD domain-containing protein n=1 Tax=Steinernema glaseri TaxID=37863 RepID=A0A1I7YAF7_9BILA
MRGAALEKQIKEDIRKICQFAVAPESDVLNRVIMLSLDDKMNLDSDIASMASLVPIIMHDMKSLPGALDIVNSKALKLSAQINAMLQAFTGFIDAVQVVSDLANNLKGASRDIGASLTRFSMRQRSVEEYFRQFAKTLNDQFGSATSHDRRHADVKRTLHDIDRRHQKLSKKSRHISRKGAADQQRDNEAAEYREICTELLRTQRSQFLWFNSLLVPVLNSQLTLFEESNNVRQVRDALEQARDVSTDTVISNLLDDLSLHSSSADVSTWQQRLGSPSRCGGRRSPSPSASVATWTDANSSVISDSGSQLYVRPYTISGAATDNGPKRANITAFTYAPPTPSGKPPLPRAPSAPQGIAGANSAVYGMQTYGAPVRPMSLNGTMLLSESTVTTPSNDSNREFLETLQEINKLGAELNSYDMYAQQQQLQHQGHVQNGQVHGSMLSVASVDSAVSRTATVRLRNGNHGQGPPSAYRPPPPERRNSSIQAATAAAPSVADIRSALSSSNNSRTSSTQDLSGANSYPPPPPPLPSSLPKQQYRY